MTIQHIGLIGYGEVGKTFALGLQPQPGVTGVGAWDLKFAQAATREADLAHAAQHGVVVHDSAAALCAASDLVISAVTASCGRTLVNCGASGRTGNASAWMRTLRCPVLSSRLIWSTARTTESTDVPVNSSPSTYRLMRRPLA